MEMGPSNNPQENRVHSFLLLLVHLIYTVVEWVRSWLKRRARRRSWTLDASDLQLRQRLTKLPVHVVLVLNRNEPECISLTELVHVVNWCLVVGIPYISLYDHKGYLIEAKHEIENKLEELSIERRSAMRETNKKSIQLKNGFTKPYLGLTDGCQSSMLRFLSKEDGREEIIKAAYDLVKQRVCHRDSSDIAIGPNALSARLKANYNFPDPDLLIRCGATPCLFGYCPWQVRLTEILPLTRESGHLKADFFEVLAKYSRCEQRFGK